MRVHRSRWANLALSCLCLSLLPSFAISSPAQAIYNGTSALGSPYVVRITGSGSACSGALVSNQIVATAAHCLVEYGKVKDLSEIKVAPPGADTSKSSERAGVLAIFYPSGFYNDSDYIEPDDIAFIALDKELAVAAIDGLATYEMTNEIVSSSIPIEIYGYGRTNSQSSGSGLPYSFIATPIAQQRYSGFFGFERKYINYRMDLRGATCPGDSGGPAIAMYKGGTYLVSINSGSRGPCSTPAVTSGSGTGTIAGEYLHIFNRAKEYLGVMKPPTPLNFVVQRVGLQAEARWTAPNDPGSLINSFLITDESGKEICRTAELSCRFSLGIGVNIFKLMSLSKSSQSAPVSYAINVTLPPPEDFVVKNFGLNALLSWRAPQGFESLISEYVVIDSQGREICRVATLSCSTNISIGENAFYVSAISAKAAGDKASAILNIKNAQVPEFNEVSIFSSYALVEWSAQIDFGNANPDLTIVEIRDSNGGKLLCSAPAGKFGCEMALERTVVSLYMNVVSDLGATQSFYVGRFSGGAALSNIEQIQSLVLSIRTTAKKLLKSDPGYERELVAIQSKLVVLDDDFKYTPEHLQKTTELFADLSKLETKILLRPKNVQIICFKSDVQRKVIGRSPKCPTGFKKR